MGKPVPVSKKEPGGLSEKEWKRFTELFAYDTNALEGSRLTKAEVRRILRKGKSAE